MQVIAAQITGARLKLTAYAGASLPLLLLLTSGSGSWSTVITTEFVVTGVGDLPG
jgi:hypothetical protein